MIRAGESGSSPISDYQSYSHTAQARKRDFVSLRETAVRYLAQKIWHPGRESIGSSDIHIKASGIRKQASIRDYADYSKLKQAFVFEVLSKVSTERELLHFCLVYNPSRLEKAGIITPEQCTCLKGMFDDVCAKNPVLLHAMEQAIKEGKSLSTLYIEDLFKSALTAPDKSDVNERIGQMCGKMSRNEAVGRVNLYATPEPLPRSRAGRVKANRTPVERRQECEQIFAPQNITTLKGLWKATWTGTRDLTERDWKRILTKGIDPNRLKTEYRLSDASKSALQTVISRAKRDLRDALIADQKKAARNSPDYTKATDALIALDKKDGEIRAIWR